MAGCCRGYLLSDDITKLNKKYYGGQKIITYSNTRIHIEKFQMAQPIAYVVEPNDYIPASLPSPAPQPNPKSSSKRPPESPSSVATKDSFVTKAENAAVDGAFKAFRSSVASYIVNN